MEIKIENPFDGHQHFREDEMMELVAPFSARPFSGGIIMPNTKEIIALVGDATRYHQSIMEVIEQAGLKFIPCMTLYLTDKTTPEEVISAYKAGVIVSVKFYPSGATHNSAHGVSDIRKRAPVFTGMEKNGVPLCIHGETMTFNDQLVDVFDREKVFLADELLWLTCTFPNLKIVMEHITTKEAVNFLQDAGENVWATVTAHHLLDDRNDMLGGGICPHLYCKPILKRVEDKLALRKLVTSGFNRVGLGSDTAPHHPNNKECACGCAGVFTAVTTLELYAQVFDEEGARKHFSGFATRMADFYGVEFPFTKTVTLEKKPQIVPKYVGDDAREEAFVIPYLAGQKIPWRVASITVK